MADRGDVGRYSEHLPEDGTVASRRTGWSLPALAREKSLKSPDIERFMSYYSDPRDRERPNPGPSSSRYGVRLRLPRSGWGDHGSGRRWRA